MVPVRPYRRSLHPLLVLLRVQRIPRLAEQAVCVLQIIAPMSPAPLVWFTPVMRHILGEYKLQAVAQVAMQSGLEQYDNDTCIKGLATRW